MKDYRRQFFIASQPFCLSSVFITIATVPSSLIASSRRKRFNTKKLLYHGINKETQQEKKSKEKKGSKGKSELLTSLRKGIAL